MDHEKEAIAALTEAKGQARSGNTANAQTHANIALAHAILATTAFRRVLAPEQAAQVGPQETK